MNRNKMHLLHTLVTDRPENHEFASIFRQKRILTHFAGFQMPYFMLIFKLLYLFYSMTDRAQNSGTCARLSQVYLRIFKTLSLI